MERTEGVTWRETVAYYTLLPTSAIGIATPVVSFAGWVTDLLPWTIAFSLPWFALGGLCAYLSVFGSAVMPAETYRHRRNRASDDPDIEYERECPACGATTFAFERCHECGDCHWRDDDD